MYSEQHRLVFVHIPKNGGTSIELFFTGRDWITRNAKDYATYLAERAHYTENWGGTLCERNWLYFQQRVREKHATQNELMARLGPARWKGCFRFTIVRNPWARILSVYDHGLRAAPGRMPKTLGAWLRQPEPLDHMGQPVFREWVSDWEDMNFVGRFEQLEKDFAHLLAVLGLPPAELPVERHGSSGQHDPAAYDDTARGIVAKRCAGEIERFNYRFENAFPSRQG